MYKTQVNSPFEYFVGLLSVKDPFEGVEAKIKEKIKKVSKILKPVIIKNVRRKETILKIIKFSFQVRLNFKVNT